MMRLVSLHLSNDRILWGQVLLEDTDNPEASMARIMIEPSDKEPAMSSLTGTGVVSLT